MDEIDVQEKLIIDLKKKIKEDVITICKQYGINEININYNLNLQLTFPIQDEIKEENE